MIHKKRKFSVVVVETVEQLAKKLTQQTWCGCDAFRLADTNLVFLNDSFSADGAQEYAVYDVVRNVQLDSITFSWCTEQGATEAIKRLHDSPPGEPFSSAPCPSLEHGSEACALCA